VSIEVERFTEVAAFSALAEPFLVEHEAENNLSLGIIGFLRAETATVGPDTAYLGLGRLGAAVTGVAIWTPGWRIVLSHPDNEAFGQAIGDAVHKTGLTMMGVLGAHQAARAFARPWELGGAQVHEANRQPIYRLARKPEMPSTPGRLREATTGDIDLLTGWWQGFARDVDQGEVSEGQARSIAVERIGRSDQMTYVWELDRPVSMALATGPTPHGIRIAGVYTPPDLRGRGYATACVSAVSRLQMEQGRQFCFLFTDAENPTSNAIYRRIGYEQVAEMVALDFVASSS
jgi:predicted GNAT family acetyltransferase